MSLIKTKTLDQLGFKNHQTKSLLINIIKKNCKHWSSEQILTTLHALFQAPADFLHDPIFNQVAASLIDAEPVPENKIYELNPSKPFAIFGRQFISEDPIKQMEVAMSLPIVHSGALMPDAHSGYGFPIGGVLATKNAVIPYAVGVDIGCRMALSIVDASDTFFKSHHYQMCETIRAVTHFGMDDPTTRREDHPILEDSRFQEMDFLRRLRGKAHRQLGTSGSGNHFVEFGIVVLPDNNIFGMPEGRYVGLLTHSGSRGLGANIAQHFSKIAQESCKLPPVAKHLAWLDMSSEAGQEYWLSMNLAGDYAKACHDVIHRNILNSLGLQTLAHIDHHHNFAWKEIASDGAEIIVHRKGATPAHKDTLGIIPGNMVDPAYIISGKGLDQSINSASHGAGRQFSRSKIKLKTTNSELKKLLKQKDVTLIGGSVAESPLAYKNIQNVMIAQEKLVHIEAEFFPKIVRMHKD